MEKTIIQNAKWGAKMEKPLLLLLQRSQLYTEKEALNSAVGFKYNPFFEDQKQNIFH